MKVGNNFDNNIIIRFLMNEASKEDVQLLEEWISMDAENRIYFEQIRDTWNSIEVEKELDEHKIQADLKRVMDRIDVGQDHAIGKAKTWQIRRNWFLRVAAVFVIGFSASWLVFRGVDSLEPRDVAYNVIETPRGSSTIINLPDGSKIWLNADSKLKYPQKFSQNQRAVYLEGEAFFEVAKEKKRQFLVRTPDLTVKVFGTSFNVKSYPDENTTETTLVEGSISIYKTSTNGQAIGREIKMDPNQRIVLYKVQGNSTPSESIPEKIKNVPARKAKLVLSKSIDTKRFTSWKDGELIIKSEPMVKLAVKLERRYNVKIHFESEDIKLIRFTGTIENETIEQVMAAIKLASSIDYRIEERVIWISKMEP